MALIQPDVTGQEVWPVSIGVGGPNQGFMDTNIIRNTEGLTVFSGSGATATTLCTIDTATYMWTGAAPATWTLTTPTNPYNGEIIQIATDTTITTGVGLLPSSGQTLSASYTGQTLSGSSSVEFRYSSGPLKWYKIR